MWSMTPPRGATLIQERIGETFFRPPTYMSFEEYLEYRHHQDQNEYFGTCSPAAAASAG